MVQVQTGVFHPLHHLGEHHDPRAAAISVAHVAAGPAEHAVVPRSGDYGRLSRTATAAWSETVGCVGSTRVLKTTRLSRVPAKPRSNT
jgi:hypothetical protein